MNGERIIIPFDFEDEQYDENTRTIKDENGIMIITYDNQGYMSHLRILNKKNDTRIEVDRYYNNVAVQVWFWTGDTEIIKFNAEFNFKDGEKPFYGFMDEYMDIDDATAHWVQLLQEYLASAMEKVE